MSNLKGVIIDAGHGGTDPGAVANGLKEKDLTLEISKHMYNILKKDGIKVYLTRNNDETLSPKKRVEIAKSYLGTTNDIILISNHINAGGGTGAEVIYALRNKKTFAEDILEELKESGLKIRKCYQKYSTLNPNKDYYFIIRDTANMESVIVEYGFIDNKEDSEKLKNNCEKYAQAVVNAIYKYKNITLNTESYYIVKKGDTLYSIAKKNNTTVEKIKDINNLKSNMISINQKLLLDENLYTVKKGDTLYNIAKKNNTTVKNIMELNNLNSSVLKINQKLKIK